MLPKIAVLLGSLTLLAGIACGKTPEPAGPVVAKVTSEQATEMATNLLESFNAGDYAAFSRDWSADMKAAIPEAGFETFRRTQLGKSGRFLSVTDIGLVRGRAAGVVRYDATVAFEKESLMVRIAFPQDGEQIVGVTFDPLS